MKECDVMTICCNICHTPINDNNSIVMNNSYTFYHRHCFNFTMENYCEILEICSFKNIKEKYSFFNDEAITGTANHNDFKTKN